MSIGRSILSATLAVSLSACGGGGSGNNTGGGTSGGTSGGTGGTNSCSLSARQDWARDVLQEWYLFPELLDTSVNKAAYSDVQSYIDALVAPARAENKDRYSTFLTSIQEENDLIDSGSNAGFGMRLGYDSAANRVYVVEAFENAPALAAGIDRGTEILQINGQSVSSLMASGSWMAVSDALGPSEPGVTRSLVVRSAAGVEQNLSVTKAEFSLDPVSDRYGVKILSDGAGGQVGYVNLRTFIIEDAAPQLRDAFSQFRAAGIDRVILDFRYNGGGLISVAALLGDLLADGREGQIFSKTVYRPSKSWKNSTTFFTNQNQQIRAVKIAVIGRDGTASASELVANSFIPYLGANIALIGEDTFGKPVGQDAFDRSACDDRLRAVTIRTVNADNGGDYYEGLAGIMPATCRADDGIFTQLGEPEEASISVALDYIAGRTCTPIISAAKTSSFRAEGGTQMLLQPRIPNAVQRENPGVF